MGKRRSCCPGKRNWASGTAWRWLSAAAWRTRFNCSKKCLRASRSGPNCWDACRMPTCSPTTRNLSRGLRRCKNNPNTSLPQRNPKRKESRIPFARLLQFFPHRIRQFEQVVEFSCAAQPLPAINHQAFTVDVARLLADQISGEVGELLVLSKALHRMRVLCALLIFLRGHQPGKSAFGRKRAGSDGVETDAVARPLHRQ